MNISAPFIKRPIGTSLLAAALLMAGALAFNFLPVAPLAPSGVPGHLGRSRTAGRKSGDHGFGGGDPAGAAVRPHRRHQPDDIGQPAGIDRHHPAVRPQSQYRCRGTRCAGRHQRRSQPASGQLARKSHLSEGESGRRAHSDSGPHFRHHHLAADIRRRRFHPFAEAGSNRRSRTGVRGRRRPARGARRIESHLAE